MDVLQCRVNDKWTEHMKHLSDPLYHSELVTVRLCIHPHVHTLVAVTISSGAVTVQTHLHNDGAALGAIQDSEVLFNTHVEWREQRSNTNRSPT